MQQTSKYQFNLVEGSDDFSPTPLNQNMEKVEEELSGLESSVMANLGTIGHNLRIQTGSYVGTGTSGSENPTSVSTQLYPVMVAVAQVSGNPPSRPPMMLMRPAPRSIWLASDNAARYVTVTWGENSVEWYVHYTYEAEYQANKQGETYHYVILGY